MEKVIDFFDNFTHITFFYFPYLSEESLPKNKKSAYFVNRAISGLTKKVFIHAGWHETSKNKEAKLIWGRQLDEFDFSHLDQHIKFNHFYHAFLIGRKDELHKRMLEYKEKNKEWCDSYPTSFLISQEKDELMKIYKTYPYWISKPAASSSGKGIKIFPSTHEIPVERGIIQQYINPYLINRKKFDFRLYFLVTSVSPMKIYMFNDGLVRFCTDNYDTTKIETDPYSHLTNYSINKDSLVYTQKKEENVLNSKWSLKFFLNTMKDKIDVDKLMNDIEIACIKVLLEGQMAIRKEHLETNRPFYGSFELYGVDVLLDENLKPYVIEVNISPSMEGGQSKMDSNIKTTLLCDTFNMALIVDNGYEVFDYINETYKKIINSSDVANDKLFENEELMLMDFFQVYLFEKEIKAQGNFHLAFPNIQNPNSYKSFSPLYSDNILYKWLSMNPKERNDLIESNISKLRKQITSIFPIQSKYDV